MRWRKLLMGLLVVVAVILVGFGVFLAAGPERVWSRIGPADLGEVDFATLQRRDSPNDALACLPQVCAAPADFAAPVFAKPPSAMFKIVADALSPEPRLEQVASDESAGTLRYVQRSRLMHYPDTVNIRIVPSGDGGSAVLLYSRSQLGKGDMGVNRARLERWIGLIQAAAQK